MSVCWWAIRIRRSRAYLLTIDYSVAVAEEGRANNCDLVIAYHPPIFHPLKRVLAGNPVFDAIRRGVAIYSPHTALDVAEGGTNDMLADVLGLTDRKPLKSNETKAAQYKLVVFVPIEAADKVSRALFDAGAGKIGNYSSCSFRWRRERGHFSGRRDRRRQWDNPGGWKRSTKSGWKRWSPSAMSMR